MGLTLPAFAGELLPERTVGEAAVGLAARHAGIVVMLAILAPVATAKLESATEQAVLKGTALVLDSQVDPTEKLELAPALLADVDIDSPRAELADSVAARRAQFGGDLAVYDRLGKRLDDVVVVAVQEAFQAVYLIAAVLALPAAALLASAWRRAGGDDRDRRRAHHGRRLRVRARHPSARRPSSSPTRARNARCPTRAACRARSRTRRCACSTAAPAASARAARSSRSRSSTADGRRQYEREHGVNPRNIGGLLSLLGG